MGHSRSRPYTSMAVGFGDVLRTVMDIGRRRPMAAVVVQPTTARAWRSSPVGRAGLAGYGDPGPGLGSWCGRGVETCRSGAFGCCAC